MYTIIISGTLLLWLVLLMSTGSVEKNKNDYKDTIKEDKNSKIFTDDVNTSEDLIDLDSSSEEKKLGSEESENKKKTDVKTSEFSLDNNKQMIEEPKSSEPSQPVQSLSQEESKSDMEIAIELQQQIGDPITYYNGHPISINECNSIGKELIDNSETTFVHRYECVSTNYGSATAVGMIVSFTVDGVTHRESYDVYRRMINN